MNPMKYLSKDPRRFIPSAPDLSNPAVRRFLRIKYLVTAMNVAITFGVLLLLYLEGIL